MKLKIFEKYFLTTALIIISSFAVIVLILSFVLNRNIAISKHDSLNKSCTEVGKYIEMAVHDGNNLGKTQFYRFFNTIAGAADADIFLTDNKGNILICGCEEINNGEDCIHSNIVLPNKELSEEINSSHELRLSTLGVYENPHYVASAIVYNKAGDCLGIVFATADMIMVRNLLSDVTKIFVTSSLIPILLMFFVIYIMTNRMSKPLRLMSQASKAMARGDFSKRIPVTSDDEIGELAISFNMMTNSLARSEGMRKNFVANVSHELKTPMTTIGGFIDGILDGTIEEDKQKYYLEIVSDEVKRLSRLVQSMLSMSKLESGEFVLKPELFDFRELICSVVISQERRIESQNINISGLDEIESISLNADRDLIYQVIYNLVDNAVKFTGEGGNISFELANKNKKTVFVITNTGKGIPQSDLPHIFERFYKVDKSRSASKNSTGLGLYIVKTIVTAHGGSISVSSKEGEYTSFKVVLPSE